MLAGSQSRWAGRASKAIPFVIGAALAIGAFAFLGWDFGHHWSSYSPGRPRSLVGPLIFLVIYLGALAPIGARWLRLRRSGSWPWAAATIESGSVALVAQGRGSAYLLTVAYSYAVNGEEYGGLYQESFSSESDARGVLESLKAMPPPARYKPADPSESVMDPYRDATLAVTPQSPEAASS